MRLAAVLTLTYVIVVLALVGALHKPYEPSQSQIVMHNGLSLTRPSAMPCALSTRDDSMLFSARTSPTGKWVVENYGNTCSDFRGNFVAIRKSGDRPSPSDKLTSLYWPDTSLFFVWTDDDHLAVKEGPFRLIVDQPIIDGPSEFKGIHITYSRYEFAHSGQDPYKAQNVTRVAFPEDHVTASFDEKKFGQGKMCELSLNLDDGTIYDAVGLDIDINATPCSGMVCGGVSSQFWVGNRLDGRYGKPLTSATVSFLPSYNKLPQGADHRAVKGGFYSNGAINLVKQLSSQQPSVQYLFNFNEDLVSYEFSTDQIRPVLDRFMLCIAGVDFNWLEHLNKPH